MSTQRSSAGFTLTEMLVSVVVLGLITSYAMMSLTAEHQTYVIVDQVSEAQQNLRVVADRMERDVRLAGYMVPEDGAVCAWDETNAPDTLFVSNADVIRTAEALTAIDPALVSRRMGVPVNGVVAATTVASPLSLAQSFIDVAADGDDFAQNAGVIVVDRNGNGAAACGIITNASPGTTLQVDFNGTEITASAVPDVVAIPATVYTVATVGGMPQLRRNGMTLSQGIEDLQVALFFDSNGNQVVDPGEWVGTSGGATYDPGAVVGSELRELRINVVVATRDSDPRSDWTEGEGQVTENRNPGSVAAADGFRRRVHSAQIQLRNVGAG